MIPSDPKERKETPVWSGFLMFFPDVFPEVARVSVEGNKQHKLGPPLRWVPTVSTDWTDSAIRHLMDHHAGKIMDEDGTYHLAKAIWRLCAEFQSFLIAQREERTEGQ